MFLGTHSQTMPNKQRYCGQLQSHVWIENFRGEWLKNFNIPRMFVFVHGLMIWKIMLRKVSSDIVSWQTGRINQSTKCPLHACEEHQFKEKESKWLTSDGVHAFDLWKSDFCRFWKHKYEPYSTEKSIVSRHQNHVHQQTEDSSMLWTRLIQFRQTSILLVKNLRWICLETMKQRSRFFLKGQSPTTRHVSRIQKVAPDLLSVRT